MTFKSTKFITITKHVKFNPRTFLVVQWLGICLPVEGTQVWSLIWEDSTCCRAAEPV